MTNELATLSARRDALLGQAEELALRREVEALEGALRIDTDYRRLVESMVSRDDPILTPQQIARETGWGTTIGPWLSKADDYFEGRCRPFYESEMDLQGIRGMGRYLAGSDEMAVAVIENLRNYTIGEGMKVTVSPKKGKGGEALAPFVQEFVDELLEENDFTNHGESSAHLSAVVDGDHLLWLRPQGPHAPRIRYVGGEHLTEPDNPRKIEDYLGVGQLCWTFGVATDHCDNDSIHGYFVNWFGQAGENWDFIPEPEAVLLKRNVPRQCKRGISDFYVPFYRIERAAKLVDMVGKQAVIQASIAGIKKAVQGTSQSQLSAALANKLTTTLPIRSGDVGGSVTAEAVLGGKILSTTADYMHGPMGTPQGPIYMEIYQGIARRVASRWSMPEYMISSDASNGNYASHAVAESPFVQAIKHEQASLARSIQELIWKAVDMAGAYGRFSGMTSRELRRSLALKVEGQDPASHDARVQEEVFDSQQAAGILSAKTRAARSNLDYEEEVANGAAKQEAPQPFGFGGFGGDGGGYGAVPVAHKLAAIEGVMRVAREMEQAKSLVAQITEAEGEQRWVTIRGAHVKVDGDGKVTYGPPELKGKSFPNSEHAPMTKSEKRRAGREFQAKADAEQLQRNREAVAALDSERNRLKTALSKVEYDKADLTGQLHDRTPSQMKAYVDAAIDWGTHDPAGAGVRHAVDRLKTAGVAMQQKGKNGSWYGKLADGKTVRVGDHLGFDAHDVDIVIDADRPLTKARLNSYLQSELEDAGFAK